MRAHLVKSDPPFKVMEQSTNLRNLCDTNPIITLKGGFHLMAHWVMIIPGNILTLKGGFHLMAHWVIIIFGNIFFHAAVEFYGALSC